MHAKIWKQRVVILTTLSSLVAPKIVLMTTYGATSNDKVVKITGLTLAK